MAESNSNATKESSDEVIKLESTDQIISESGIKGLLASNDPRDKKKLNLTIRSIVEENNTDALALLVNCGYKLDVISSNGQTPLHLAFYNCNTYKIDKHMVDLIFSCAGDTNFKDSMGLTHLHVACTFGNVDTVEKFIKNKEDMNARFRYQLTPLHFAVMHYRLEIVRILVKNGANLTAVDQMGRTPLHFAACVSNNFQKAYHHNDDLEIFKFLLEHQFNIHIKDKDGNTPLLSIFQHLRADYEENLIWHQSTDESDSDFKCNDLTALSARQRDKLIILLKAGANITGGNKVGDTILHRIIRSTILLRTPSAHSNVSFDDTQHVEMVKQILAVEQNFNINAKNQKGETPLQIAISCLSAEIVKVLLNHKADMNDLNFQYFNYTMVPNFECVQNMIAITELLKNEGFEMKISHELPILNFLIHNHKSCNCTDLNQYFNIRNYLEVLIHFGSSAHIRYIFKRVFKTTVINSTYSMEPLLMDILGYLNYLECGNFYIDNEVCDTLTRTLRKVNFCMLPFKPEKNEIEKMKGTKMRSCITLYNVMQKNPNVIYKYIKNEDFGFIKNFPEYQVIIKGHLTKSLIRNYVEKTTYDYLKLLIPYSLNRTSYKTISKYLSNEDLLNIVTVIFTKLLEKVN